MAYPHLPPGIEVIREVRPLASTASVYVVFRDGREVGSIRLDDRDLVRDPRRASEIDLELYETIMGVVNAADVSDPIKEL